MGKKKVSIACKKLREQNPGITLKEHDLKVSSENVLDLVDAYDIIVDCTDNFETRYLLNDAAVIKGRPLVYGAIYQYEGQVAVWNILKDTGERTPNYRDIFPSVDASQVPNCADGGVIPTLAGIIGCMQANEVIKFFTQTGELLCSKLLIIDAQTLQSRIIKTGLVTKTNIQSLITTEIIPTISAAEFKKKFNHSSVELVDIRNEGERIDFNIGGMHIPLNELEDRIPDLEVAKPIVFYCATGKRSAEAVRIIRKKIPGVQAMSLEGGLKAWMEDHS